MIGGQFGILIILGVVATVALGLLKKLEVDVEGKFEIPGLFSGKDYESKFDFEWELEREKKDRKHHEKRVNKMKDSRDLMQKEQQDIPQSQRQPVPAVPSYYYPFYPSPGVPPTYPYFYF